MMILYKFLLSSLVALQVIGPSWVLAIQTSQALVQGVSKSPALIAGIRGVVTVTPGQNRPGYAPKYRSALAIGDVISTEEESVAEVLLENQGLVTIQEYSEAMLNQSVDGGLSIALEMGMAEWSVPIHSQVDTPFTFTTPNIHVTTRGGLITAEVQPTLGEMARAPRQRDSFLVLASLSSQSAGDVGLLETFCVNEGGLTIEYPGVQQDQWKHETISPGECRGFLNGQPRAMPSAMGTSESTLADWREVCVVGTHCEIPESAKELIAKKQMSQALALEQALLGKDLEKCELVRSEKQECLVDEQIILATTGLSNGTLLAGDIVGGGPGNGNNGGGVILPCTGDPQFCGGGNGGGNGGGVPPNPTPPPQAPGVNVGGVMTPPSQFFAVGTSAPGAQAPHRGFPTNVQPGGQLWPANGLPGGGGLLTFLNGEFTADKELFLADSGILSDAPHLGKAPQNSLVVSDLRPNGAGSPSNQNLPIRFGAYTVTLPDFNPPPFTVQLGTEGTTREAQSRQLAQFARSPLIDPDNPLGSLPMGACEFSSESCLQVVLGAGEEGLEDPEITAPGPLGGIDGTLQVRSASTLDPRVLGNRVVTLKKGVVLGENTHVSIASQEQTKDSFSGLEPLLGQEVEGAAVSLLGRPGDPSIVEVEDRVLAIVEGSRIQSADPAVKTALIAVLDGRLHGPEKQSVIGEDAVGNDVLRDDVSPIIEMIDGSADVTTGVMVGSTANAGQLGDLDQALLEASSPLLAMIGSSVTTASDFGRVAGQNAKLVATLVPGDALVRLNSSSLMVNGNLFSVTGGGQLIVNGSLLSVQGGSTVTLNGGVFVNVGAGSMFSLTNGALVDFGSGTNTVNVSNSLCAGGGCFSPFANPTYQVAGNPADFSVAPGFDPVADLGTFPDGSVNTLNVGTDAAILSVESGGSIQLQ